MINSKNVLIVIDMQYCFVNHGNSAYSRAIRNVTKEIKAAISRNDYILFVEYDREVANHTVYKNLDSERQITKFPTLQELRDLTRDYPNVIYVFKKSTDGGDEIIQTLIEKEISHDTVRICGAYTQACVSETVQTLSFKLKNSQIYLVPDAMASYAGCEMAHNRAVTYMVSMRNVEINNKSIQNYKTI